MLQFQYITSVCIEDHTSEYFVLVLQLFYTNAGTSSIDVEQSLMRWIILLQPYCTVAGSGEATEVEKKSKFIAQVAPAPSQAQAEEFIAEISKKHWNATHNVYAYMVGADSGIQKCSDDGEPSGTSGLPTLEAIKSLNLTNVVVVVTRYFGGTLLGRGGLIRAYGLAAKSGLLAAGMIKRIPHQQVAVTVDYSLSGKVQNELITSGVTISEAEYLADVTFTIDVIPEQLVAVQQKIQELTADNFIWQLGNQVYHDQLIGD